MNNPIKKIKSIFKKSKPKCTEHEWKLVGMAYRCGDYGCRGASLYECVKCGKQESR